VVITFNVAGFFTSSGGTPARAGLMRGYTKLLYLYRVKENYHAIADEESIAIREAKKISDNRYFFIFPSERRTIEQTMPDLPRCGEIRL
jgi:hypothetical protein